MQLVELQGGRAEIEKRGWQLAGLSYDTPEILAQVAKRRAVTFTLLSDPKSEVIKRYGLLDPDYKPGSKAYGVPRPIMLIIGKDGIVKAKLYEESFTKRPPVTLLLETLDGLEKKATP